MTEIICLLHKDTLVIKTPKRSPLVFRTVVLFFVMVCGVYILSICLKQTSLHTKARFLNLQVIEQQPCPVPGFQPWENIPYQHFPKPKTFNREECGCNPVRYFAILSAQRSGSGWFETLLNSHMNVSSNGEIFGDRYRRSNASVVVETLDRVYSLDWISSSSKNECSAAVGFKWMLNQGLMENHEEIVEYFNRRGVSAIILFRRNLLRRMISLLANSYDSQAKLLNGTHKSHVHSPQEADILATYKPKINTTILIRDMMQEEDQISRALQYFSKTRHIVVYYEDVVSNKTKLSEVQKFLGVPDMELSSRQVKIHKGPLQGQVENWDEIERIIKGTMYERFLQADYEL
ncbi:nodulation protein H-like [Impatiens glandulifera]|uniref:nodulation protein H-like n=1 Tax=Impatiens glandulifera TaxID=253017 RepID=UPI001FB14743|nr:nodulation protein H-like [Impatiens glandulifera]